MQITASIDPVTRIEGHMRVEVEIDTVRGVKQVVSARSIGTLFRGFEKILVGRDPHDAQHITERICGVCPVSHAMAAVLALDKACGVNIPANARILRNLVMGANFLDSHVLHFYLLCAMDYVAGPNMAPWQPSWAIDRRLDSATNQRFVEHYLQAISMRRKAHEMGAIFGGRMPHPPTFMAGGITTLPSSAQIALFRQYLEEITAFISDVYMPDVEALAHVYPDYYEIGAGPGRLLAYGAFDLDAAGKRKLFRRGWIAGAASPVRALNLKKITEQVGHSWYKNTRRPLNPASGRTDPQNPKAQAYSWLKAPRYRGEVHEVGALARMWINGDYRRGISVMDRHRARAAEALKIAQAMRGWLSQVVPDGPVVTQANVPAAARSTGLTEAPRGALGHWLKIAGGKISSYQVITPSCWNCSPRDSREQPGALEQALVGTPVEDPAQPLEVLRVLHSFDPCLDCAVHVMKPRAGSENVVYAPLAACQRG